MLASASAPVEPSGDRRLVEHAQPHARRLGCRGLEPFRLAIPDAELTDLRERLRRTRWPERETAPEQGVPLEDLQALCAHWADGYDWRATEARLNAIPQFRTEIDGLRHPLPSRALGGSQRASRSIMSHGWPGSVARVPRRRSPR